MRTRDTRKQFYLYNEAKLNALTPATHYIIRVSVITSRGAGSVVATVAETMKNEDDGELFAQRHKNL